MKNKLGWALATWVMGTLMLGATGCGGGDDDAPPATAQSACETYCNKEDGCEDTTTVDECLLYACSGIDKTSSGCQTALKAYFECMNQAANICDTASCAAQETTYHEAC